MPIFVKRISRTRIRIISNHSEQAQPPTPPSRKRQKRQEIPAVAKSPMKPHKLPEKRGSQAPESTTSTEAHRGEVPSKEQSQAAATKPELTKRPSPPRKKNQKSRKKHVEATGTKKQAQPKKQTKAPKGASKPPVAARAPKASQGKSPSLKNRKRKEGK